MYRVADDADKALMQAYSAYARHIDSDTGSKKTQAREVKELYQKAHELYEVQIKALKAKIKKSRVFLRGDHDYVLSLEHEAPECAVKLSKAVVGVKEYLIEALEEKLESVSGQLVVNRKMEQRYLEDLMAVQGDQKPVLRPSASLRQIRTRPVVRGVLGISMSDWMSLHTCRFFMSLVLSTYISGMNKDGSIRSLQSSSNIYMSQRESLSQKTECRYAIHAPCPLPTGPAFCRLQGIRTYQKRSRKLYRKL